MPATRRAFLEAAGAALLLGGPGTGFALESRRLPRAVVLHADDSPGSTFMARLQDTAPDVACTPVTLTGLTDLQACRRMLAGHAGGLLVGLVGDDTAPLVIGMARDTGARAAMLAQHVESRGRVRHHFAFVTPGLASTLATAPRSDWVTALALACAGVLAGRAAPADVVARLQVAAAHGRAGGYESFIYRL